VNGVPHHEPVEKTLAHEPVDRLPRGELFIDRGFLDTYVPHFTGDRIRQLERAALSFGLDLVGADVEGPDKTPLLTRQAYKRLGQFFSVACVNGPVSHLIASLGFLEAMSSLKKDVTGCERLFSSKVAQFRDMVPLIRNNGFKAVAITDDIAGNQGLLFSPQVFNDLIRPYYEQLVELTESSGLWSFFHSDGDTSAILKSVADMGFNCLHPVDSQAGMDPYVIRDTVGRAICLMGSIDIIGWSPDRIRQEVEKFEQTCHDGGFIVGSSCGISLEGAGGGLSALYPGWRGGLLV